MTRLPAGLVLGLLLAISAWVTWPLAAHLGSGVSDFGDPLLNSWILAWDAHALATSPWHVFDANIFHPETSTLAYSETLLLPGVVLAPLMWLGGNGILAHNVLELAGYALSGLGVFALVRRLTAHDGAALVAAVAFAVYPYRMEGFAKVQMELAFFWPLALLALHDLLWAPGWRRAGLLSLALAGETYTCVYYGIFGAIGIAVVSIVSMVMARASGRRALMGLAAAAVGFVVLVAPLAGPYWSASRVVGVRSMDEVEAFSATLRDYGRPNPESWLYGDEGRPGFAERRLFPGYAAPALAVGAFVPPVAPVAFAYLAAGLVSLDLSLGVNAPGYRWLYRWLTPMRALRVPARFGMFVGLALAVLAGLGAARACRGRTRAAQIALVGLALTALVAEGRMRPQELVALDDPAPTIYAWLAGQPKGVVCEYPLGNLEGRVGPQDATYMLYSTRHWDPLVNGYSGFAPPSYRELLARLQHFPDAASIAYLRARGVRYLLVHQKFYIKGDYAADVAALRQRADVRWVGRFRWKTGETSDAFLLETRGS